MAYTQNIRYFAGIYPKRFRIMFEFRRRAGLQGKHRILYWFPRPCRWWTWHDRSVALAYMRARLTFGWGRRDMKAYFRLKNRREKQARETCEPDKRFEVDLERPPVGHIHVTIYGNLFTLGVWVYSPLCLFPLEIKNVGWPFYWKLKVGFWCLGMEFLHYGKRIPKKKGVTAYYNCFGFDWLRKVFSHAKETDGEAEVCG